mmetsp:Transcript_14462/g.25297  ORF Transcript_14462/g.25297 Transcript_14462/m.25297 type:complete len:595 (+) Transcript_14462:194-1978(+)
MPRKVVVCICDTDELASRALESLASSSPEGGVRVLEPHEYGEDAIRAFPHAANTVQTTDSQLCAFELSLDEARDLVFNTKKRMAEHIEHEHHGHAADEPLSPASQPMATALNSEQEQGASETTTNMPSDAAFEELTTRYREVYRYCVSVQNELLDVLFRFIPEQCPGMASLMQMEWARERNDTISGLSLRDRIGNGSFGSVFACVTANGRDVVVKKMQKAKKLSIRKMTQFADQLHLLLEPDLRNRHPNLLYLDRVLQSSHHIYLVMPRLRCDAYQMLEACVPTKDSGFDEGLALQVVKPVVSALFYLHMQGYAHRDVKSENIAVDYTTSNTGEITITDVRLIDFDLCCRFNSVHITKCVGSLGFMAPELMIRRTPRFVAKLDVWSVACVLLELCMGCTWFTNVWLNVYRQYRTLRSLSSSDTGVAQRYVDLRQSLLRNRADSMSALSHPLVLGMLERCLDVDAYSRIDLHSLAQTLGVLRNAAAVENTGEEAPMVAEQEINTSSNNDNIAGVDDGVVPIQQDAAEDHLHSQGNVVEDQSISPATWAINRTLGGSEMRVRSDSAPTLSTNAPPLSPGNGRRPRCRSIHFGEDVL